MLRKRLTKESYAIRTIREIGLLCADIGIVTISFMAALILGQIYIIRADVALDNIIWEGALKALAVIVPLYALFFWIFRVFKVVWRYARGKDYLRIIGATTVAFVIFIFIDQKFQFIAKDGFTIPELNGQLLKVYPVYVLFYFISNAVLLFSRIIYEFLFTTVKNKKSLRPRRATLIVGGGLTAATLIEELLRPESIYVPICIVDDDPEKKGRLINDVEIVGTTKEIEAIVKKYDIKKNI